MTLRLDSRIDSANRIGGGLTIEADGLLPSRLEGLSNHDIEQLPVLRGNRETALGELFAISGDLSDGEIALHGNMRALRRLGSGMKSGKITVHGDVGAHLGSRMEGGEIEVHGNAGDWLGSEMRGGTLRVHGNAGDCVGSGYQGSPRGMTGGTLLVHGNVGHEIGTVMRRGLIAIGKDAGKRTGQRMLAGTILIAGQAGNQTGVGMKRGTIAVLGEEMKQRWPTFNRGYRGKPPALGLVLRELRRLNFPLPKGVLDWEFDLFHGDMLEGGRGEIFLGGGA